MKLTCGGISKATAEAKAEAEAKSKAEKAAAKKAAAEKAAADAKAAAKKAAAEKAAADANVENTCPADCHCWLRCQAAFQEFADEKGFDIKEYLDSGFDRCFCNDCHTSRGDKNVYTQGNPGKEYVLPIGFARLDCTSFNHPLSWRNQIIGMFATMEPSMIASLQY